MPEPGQVITLPASTVILDGNASTDPDKNISGYEWSKIQGPAIYNLAVPFAVQTQLTEMVYSSNYLY